MRAINGTYVGRRKKKGLAKPFYVVGIRLDERHRQIPRSRAVVMFALKQDIPSTLEVHHNDQDVMNDKPSNLALCTSEQHRILDALSLLRGLGFKIGLRPNGTYHKSLEGVIWIGDLLKDYGGVIEDAVAWVKEAVQVWDMDKQAILRAKAMPTIVRRL